MKRLISAIGLALFMAGLVVAGPASAADKKPNILVIWGDDIGGFNISAYNYSRSLVDGQLQQGKEHEKPEKIFSACLREDQLLFGDSGSSGAKSGCQRESEEGRLV